MFSKRTINFECNFTIESLEEVPIKASDVSVVWSFKESGSFSLFKNKLTGKTDGKQIQDNRVEWKQPFKINISIPVNSKTNELEHFILNFQILCQKTVHTQVDTLGKVQIDLLDYAQGGKLTKSFLLRESLVNSTLKVTLEMIQVSGDRLFKSPKKLEDEKEIETDKEKKKVSSKGGESYIPPEANLQVNPEDVIQKVITNTKIEKVKPENDEAKTIIDDILNSRQED